MIELVYSNGCSHVAGGGLELSRVLDTDTSILVKNVYYEKYGVEWKNQNEVTFIKKLADKLKCKSVNEATSGGGSSRVIRMAYDFVKNNWDKRDKIFMFLEFPSFFTRIEIYSNVLKDYLIVNQNFDENQKRVFLYATRSYFNNNNLKDFDIINKNKELEIYLENFISLNEEENKIIREIEMLLTFLLANNIKFIWCEGSKTIQNKINSNLLKYELKIDSPIGLQNDFHGWIIGSKLSIKDELENKTTDLHPGYFGHQKFADFLFDYINKNYE